MSDDTAALDMQAIRDEFQLESIELWVLGLFVGALIKRYDDPRILPSMTDYLEATRKVCAFARAESITIEASCFLELRRRGLEKKWPLKC